MKFRNIEKIRSMEENTKNVFKITAPYYLVDSINSKGTQKVIFFGCDFRNLAKDVDLPRFIKLTNQCLDYIRRECHGLDLYYMPHPVEKEEYRSLDLHGFKIEIERTIGEWYLYKNLSQIKYVFSHFSTVSMSAFGLGLNSYVFSPLFKKALGRVGWEGYSNFFGGMPDIFFIKDLDEKLKESRSYLVKNEFLENQWKEILSEHKGTIWFIFSDPGFILTAASFSMLIKNISPERKVRMLANNHKRWDLINIKELRSYFDEITFLPMVIYSLKPKWLINIIKNVVATKRFKVNSEDVFFMFGPNSFIGNCCISYYKNNFRVGLIREKDFETDYRFKYPLRKEDYQMRWPGVFFYKFVEPLLGLYPGIRRLERPGSRGAFGFSRFQGLLNEIFNLAYVLKEDSKK